MQLSATPYADVVEGNGFMHPAGNETAKETKDKTTDL